MKKEKELPVIKFGPVGPKFSECQVVDTFAGPGVVIGIVSYSHLLHDEQDVSYTYRVKLDNDHVILVSEGQLWA